MSSPTVAAPVSVPLDKVEHELSQQMRLLQGDDETPVRRVRMSNLVVYCETEAQAAQVDAQIPEVVATHPARVVVLVGDPGGPDQPLTATVSVRPHGPEKDPDAASEQVTLRAGGSVVESLPFAARSLLIGDLPTNLWWASVQPPGLAGMLLYNLAESAQQIIYDSLGWTDPPHGVATTAAWLEHAERSGAGLWRVASDLNWRRLKFWRRLLSQSLDSGAAPGAAESIHEVVVEHGPHAVVEAWELVSWLASRLAWQIQSGKVEPGVEIDWRFGFAGSGVLVRVRRLTEGPPRVQRLRLACYLGDKPAGLLFADEGGRLSSTLEGADAEPRTITVPRRTDAELVGRQLSDRERDPIFKESMAVARVLAESLLEY
jgi:glucose-6-phosphate dehydrogenase assembly protein OpcA